MTCILMSWLTFMVAWPKLRSAAGRGSVRFAARCAAICLISLSTFNYAFADVASKVSPPLEPPQAALLKGVGFAQRLDSQVPINLEFTNDRGQTVTFADCMGGRPTVFVLAYYRCPMLCNQVLNGVARTLQAIDLEPGKHFEVVVVSFDPTDTVTLAAGKKESVVRAFDRDGDGTGWHFLIGRQEPVAKIADSVGFQYQFDSATGQYAHASGMVVLTPEGRVARYFYGIDYPTRDVRLGLVEASKGRIGSAVDELLLFCFHYDPFTGRYGLAIIRVIRAAGVATVAAILGYVGISLSRERRLRRNAAQRNGLQQLQANANDKHAFGVHFSPDPSLQGRDSK